MLVGLKVETMPVPFRVSFLSLVPLMFVGLNGSDVNAAYLSASDTELHLQVESAGAKT